MLKVLTFYLLSLLHPVHVSITTIDYSSEISAFKVLIRMYLDDFLLDGKLKEDEIRELNLSSKNSAAKAAVNAYINDRVSIKSDGIQLSARLKDIKLKDNEVNFYLDYPVEKKPAAVTVKCTVLTGIYSDQSNMVILKVNDFENGAKLNAGMAEYTFVIN